jgi:hypothetical protein
VDLRQQNLLRTFTVMPNLPIRGTRWINANKLVCFTTDNVDKTSFKNNIFVVDIKTGQLKEVRKVRARTFLPVLNASRICTYILATSR